MSLGHVTINGIEVLVKTHFSPPAAERPHASKHPIPKYVVATPINQNIILSPF